MGDNLKLSKDKRHRSSSSIAGSHLEGTRSERRLNLKVSIPEVDDQFALAEARCDDLQEKIDIVKGLKRKRKLKKRSATRVNEADLLEDVPYISVRTLPKKKVVQQAARASRRAGGASPAPRGYADAAAADQFRMLAQVHGFNHPFKPQHRQTANQEEVLPRMPKPRIRLARADGDSVAPGTMRHGPRSVAAVACGDDEVIESSSGQNINDAFQSSSVNPNIHFQKPVKPLQRRRQVLREASLKEGGVEAQRAPWAAGSIQSRNVRRQNSAPKHSESVMLQHGDDRRVVELFHKERSVHSVDLSRCNSRHQDTFTDDSIRNKEKNWRQLKRIKYRSRRYEQPTVASQMKQATMRYYSSNGNYTAIPFIVSKSTAPSHNIGVNIQQVLNGFKNQQPLSCIPLTIAHHMGLGHIPHYETNNVQPCLANREINAIRLGQRLVRLPSYKYVSYNRLLNLYREGDGMVSRFLRSIDRPQHFYTSMYNLATRDDLGGATATTKSREKSEEAKQRLAEYASLYREFEQTEKRLRESYSPELERRKDELVRQLAAREEQIRKVVQDYRSSNDIEGLRASASVAEDTYRMSTVKLPHAGDPL